MDKDIVRTSLRVLLVLILAGVLAVMVLMIMRYRQDMQERSARIAALTAEASAYEAELNELRRKQETEEMHLYMPEGPGAAVIAFLIDGKESLNMAREYGDSYGFTPAILLKPDDKNIDYIIQTISNSGLDVIFYSRGNETAAQIRQLRERLEEAGCGDTSAYLLRTSDDTEANRKTLFRAGITTLFLYGDFLNSDVTENGTVELNYSYVNKSSYNPSNRLNDLNGSEQGLLFAIDLVETTATSRQLDAIIGMICEEADSGHITIGSVADAAKTVKNRLAREKANLEEFLSAQEERKARIEELEDTIREIYSHWDDQPGERNLFRKILREYNIFR